MQAPKRPRNRTTNLWNFKIQPLIPVTVWSTHLSNKQKQVGMITKRKQKLRRWVGRPPKVEEHFIRLSKDAELSTYQVSIMIRDLISWIIEEHKHLDWKLKTAAEYTIHACGKNNLNWELPYNSSFWQSLETRKSPIPLKPKTWELALHLPEHKHQSNTPSESLAPLDQS